jgi:hypothetical protein
MIACIRTARAGVLAVAVALGAAVFAGAAAAESDVDGRPSDPPASRSAESTAAVGAAGPRRPAVRAAHPTARSQRAAPRVPEPAAAGGAPDQVPASARAAVPLAVESVSVDLPPMPVTEGLSFTVSPEAVAGVAQSYLEAGGDPEDSPRFFFGDLAVASLEEIAAPEATPEQIRTGLGNLTASGYFGGIWLRDNLRDPGTVSAAGPVLPGLGSAPSSIAIRLFDLFAGGLVAAAASPRRWVVTTAARASVPVLLALYGYNRGYLEVLLDNPPDGVPSMRDTLTCEGFLDCNSTAFPLEIANRYDAALSDLATPPSLRWAEMALWTTVLEGATGAGRFVWELIAGAGAFSPASYAALVDLSSAYLMVSKAAVLASMLGADRDAELGAGALRLHAGLWMWSGSYFAGLASDAPAGTLPRIVVS